MLPHTGQVSPGIRFHSSLSLKQKSICLVCTLLHMAQFQLSHSMRRIRITVSLGCVRSSKTAGWPLNTIRSLHTLSNAQLAHYTHQVHNSIIYILEYMSLKMPHPLEQFFDSHVQGSFTSNWKATSENQKALFRQTEGYFKVRSGRLLAKNAGFVRSCFQKKF